MFCLIDSRCPDISLIGANFIDWEAKPKLTLRELFVLTFYQYEIELGGDSFQIPVESTATALSGTI